MRIVAWNIENLARWLPGAAAKPGARNPPSPARFRAHVAALGEPDILCLQEIRLRPQDRDLIAAARALLPGYTCHLALANDPRNVKYRGGRAYGVATYVRDTLGTVSSATPAWDREGRVVVTAHPAHALAVINLYAVNGTDAPYWDPASGAQDGDRHAHKQRFQARIFALADELRTTANVVIAGDWNVSRTAADVTPRLRTEEPHAAARAQLNARISDTTWIDAFRSLHPEARKFTWFGPSRYRLDAARVDYILVDPDLLERVTTADILDAKPLRPHSDHAPLLLELDAS